MLPKTATNSSSDSHSSSAALKSLSISISIFFRIALSIKLEVKVNVKINLNRRLCRIQREMAEADTQPLEEKPGGQEEEELVVEKNGVWGWLVPINSSSHINTNLVSLKEGRVTVGREADVVIEESLFEGNGVNRSWL